MGIELHDSHAEVVARRALVRFLIEELIEVLSERKDIQKSLFKISKNKHKFKIRKQYRIHMFTSKPPCGACSIELTQSAESNFQFLGGAKPLKDFFKNCSDSTTQKMEISELTSKPYRTDTAIINRSASLSCSDKIMCWNLLGLQGKALGLFLEPVYINSIIVVGDENHKKNVERALSLENKLCWTREEVLNKVFFFNSKKISKKHRVTIICY